MVSIDKAMTVFLEAQEMRLKQRTYRDYESVIELFQIYLNSYAYLRLPQEEREKYVSRFSRDEQYFTKTYGLDQFTTSIYSEFFEYFIVRKVASGETFMKSAVRVIKKLTTWLFEEDYINSKKYRKLIEYFAEGKTKSLPKAEKVADLIFALTRRAPDKEYDEILEDNFEIVKIEPKKLWLDSMFKTRQNIGPLMVTKQISDMCEEGWDLYLKIGKDKGKWIIIESGNVYPTNLT